MQVYNNWARDISTGAPLPEAQIDVYDAGTLVHSQLYEDDGVTPLGNPFTADLVTGIYQFYAADGSYDVTVSKVGYTSYTIPKVLLWTPATSLIQVLHASVTLTNAQIIALPTTAVELIPAPPTGYRNKVLGATYQLNNAAGAYGNVDPTYAVLGLGMPSMAAGWWLLCPLVNDSNLGITYLTAILTNAASHYMDLSVPMAIGATVKNVASVAVEGALWITNNNFPTLADVQGAVNISMDNNGAGVLTGGHASNVLKATAYYVLEAI